MNEVTKHMIRTPYGILSMPSEVFERFVSADEPTQWEALRIACSKGGHNKAQAMQWYWARQIEIMRKDLN